jgi:hypothetical protein
MCYMEMVRREICLKVNSKSKIIFMFFFSFLFFSFEDLDEG